MITWKHRYRGGDMRICINFMKRGQIEPSTMCIEPEELLYGKNIKDALRRLGVTPNNFVEGIVYVTDKDENLELSFPFNDYDDFEKEAWYIRQKLKKKERLWNWAKKQW